VNTIFQDQPTDQSKECLTDFNTLWYRRKSEWCERVWQHSPSIQLSLIRIQAPIIWRTLVQGSFRPVLFLQGLQLSYSQFESLWCPSERARAKTSRIERGMGHDLPVCRSMVTMVMYPSARSERSLLSRISNSRRTVFSL
jgi:hypothetical protein